MCIHQHQNGINKSSRAEGWEQRSRIPCHATCLLHLFAIHWPFTNKSKIFREYVGIVIKLAAYYKHYLELQAKVSSSDDIQAFESSIAQYKKENCDCGKGKLHTTGTKTRQAFKQIFSAPKSMLSTFRHKNSKNEVQGNDDDEKGLRTLK